MRVVIEKPPEGGEEELIVRVNQLSERVLELLRVIQAEDEKLMCYHEDGSLSVLCPSSVFYFESVDNRVYAYEKAEVSELKQKLAPSFSGRFEAILQNGEKVVISRQYVPAVKKRLGL